MNIINNFLNLALLFGFIFFVYYIYIFFKGDLELKSLRSTKTKLDDKAFFEANINVNNFLKKRKTFVENLDKNTFGDVILDFNKCFDEKQFISFEDKIKLLNKIDEISIEQTIKEKNND